MFCGVRACQCRVYSFIVPVTVGTSIIASLGMKSKFLKEELEINKSNIP